MEPKSFSLKVSPQTLTEFERRDKLNLLWKVSTLDTVVLRRERLLKDAGIDHVVVDLDQKLHMHLRLTLKQQQAKAPFFLLTMLHHPQRSSLFMIAAVDYEKWRPITKNQFKRVLRFFIQTDTFFRLRWA